MNSTATTDMSPAAWVAVIVGGLIVQLGYLSFAIAILAALGS